MHKSFRIFSVFYLFVFYSSDICFCFETLLPLSPFMASMSAVLIEKFGKESVLQVKSLIVPNVTENQVLVKVISAGVNPVDTYIREGNFVALPSLPFVPGKDGAGIVHTVGKNVTRFLVGDRVFICDKSLENEHGTYAEYCVVSQENCFLLSEKLTFDEGAALGTPFFTAIKALMIKGFPQLDSKQTSFDALKDKAVLIHGATGAVGTACVQVALHMGLTVIGTSGTAPGMNMLKEMGVHYALCHNEKKYLEKVKEITENRGVNLIVEMLANKNLNDDLDILAPNGRIVVVGCRGSVEIDPRKLMVPETEIIGLAVYASTPSDWQAIAEIALDGISEGWIKPVINRKYTLAQAGEAQRDILASTGAKGKLILTVQTVGSS